MADFDSEPINKGAKPTELLYKKYELMLVAAGLAVSLIAMVFLLVQNSMMKAQTTALSRSVESQEIALASSQNMNEFEMKRFLMERFTPNVLESELDLEFGSRGLTFGWELSNQTSSQLVITNHFGYDLVRCFNREHWNGETWNPYKEDQDDSIDQRILDYSENKYRWTDILSGAPQPLMFTLTFPEGGYSNFQMGEKIAVEVFSVIFDPDQIHFRDQMDDMGFRIGRGLTVAGADLVFPAIRETLSWAKMFELTEGGWVEVPLESSCTNYL